MEGEAWFGDRSFSDVPPAGSTPFPSSSFQTGERVRTGYRDAGALVPRGDTPADRVIEQCGRYEYGRCDPARPGPVRSEDKGFAGDESVLVSPLLTPQDQVMVASGWFIEDCFGIVGGWCAIPSRILPTLVLDLGARPPFMITTTGRSPVRRSSGDFDLH
jgi:hypothetical protein